jgi:phosphohistidine phosphatase
MRTLLLLRHAKSSWDDPDLPDFKRPLAPRGRRAARALARYFQEATLRPDRILCSPATRTRQTLAALAESRDAPLQGTPVEEDERIYEARSQDLLRRVREVPGAVRSLLVVGHNPGMADLALLLLGSGPHHPSLARLREKVPTGALITLEIPEGDWTGLGPGSCRLASFLRPVDLPEPGQGS